MQSLVKTGHRKDHKLKTTKSIIVCAASVCFVIIAKDFYDLMMKKCKNHFFYSCNFHITPSEHSIVQAVMDVNCIVNQIPRIWTRFYDMWVCINVYGYHNKASTSIKPNAQNIFIYYFCDEISRAGLVLVRFFFIYKCETESLREQIE